MKRVAAGLGVILVVTLAFPAAAADDAGFADGQWTGTLIYTGDVVFPDVTAWAAATGSFDMDVAGGIVASGTFDFQASGVGVETGAGAAAALDFIGSGGVEGNADGPLLRPDSIHITGTAEAQGVQVPIDFSFGPGEANPIPLEIFAATCTEVTGDFTQTVAEAVGAAGGSGDFFGRFVAYRTGDAPLDSVDQLTQLIEDAESLNAAAEQGMVNHLLLLDALDRAEQLAAAIPYNADCGLGVDPGTFQLSISMVVSDLVEAAIAAADALTLPELQAVVSAGIRSGVLGAGAPPGSQAEELSIGLEAVFDQRLTDALNAEPDDLGAIEQIMLTALSMGWDSLAASAKEFL